MTFSVYGYFGALKGGLGGAGGSGMVRPGNSERALPCFMPCPMLPYYPLGTAHGKPSQYCLLINTPMPFEGYFHLAFSQFSYSAPFVVEELPVLSVSL